MDWKEYPLVEVVPGKMSGAPVIVRSRVRPDDLIANREEGPEWLGRTISAFRSGPCERSLLSTNAI